MKHIALMALAAVGYGFVFAMGYRDSFLENLVWLGAAWGLLFGLGYWAATRDRSPGRLLPERNGFLWVLGLGALCGGILVASRIQSYPARTVLLAASGFIALLTIYLTAHPPERWQRPREPQT